MNTPSIFSQLVSFTRAVTKHVAHGLKPAKPETQEKRALICSECPELIKETFRCGKCGCFLKYKIAWSTTSCPIDKWKEEEEDE